MIKTTFVRKEDRAPRWHLVDAKGLVLGRLASRVARILMGKHRPIYTPHVDTGDFVVVINAKEIVVTGRKLEQERYYHHTGYLGGMRETPWNRVFETKPERLIQMAVKRMLPKTKLGRKMFTKLKVYAGSEHHHSAQKPTPLTLS
jgi:large subunit ribosomal protein L13